MPINLEDISHMLNNIDVVTPQGVQEIMSEIMSCSSSIGWEIGPDPENEENTYLALTCRGNLELLSHISRTYNLPRVGLGWRIIAGSPRKNWDGYFEIESEEGRVFAIDGHKWAYSIREKTITKILIDIYLPEELNDAILSEAVQVLLIGEVGEWSYAKHISVSEVNTLRGSRDAVPITMLWKTIVGHFPDCTTI